MLKVVFADDRDLCYAVPLDDCVHFHCLACTGHSHSESTMKMSVKMIPVVVKTESAQTVAQCPFNSDLLFLPPSASPGQGSA